MRRRTWPLLLLAILGIGCCLVLDRAGRNSRLPVVLAAGEFYQIPVSDDETRFALRRVPAERHVLVVGNLGSSGDQQTIRLHGRQVASARNLSPRLAGLSIVRPLPHAPGRPPGSCRVTLPEVAAQSRGETCQTALAERDFHIHIANAPLELPQAYTRVSSRLIGEGRGVRVYLDKRESETSVIKSRSEDTIRLIDDELLPALSTRLGTIRDVDADGKLAILLTPLLAQLQGGQTSVNGFVRSTDFRTDLEIPFSNRADVVYLNSTSAPGADEQTLLTHELTHAVCFSRRLPAPNCLAGLPDEEDWLNEAIAHVVENSTAPTWSNLDHRVCRYLNDPGRYPLVVPDYFRAGLWREHGCRGATYLFLSWYLRQFGDQLADLTVQPAAGQRNLELQSGIPFRDLFRAWTISLVTDGSHGGCSFPARTLAAPLPEMTVDAGSSRAGENGCIGKMGRCGLAGPRRKRWDPSQGDAQVTVVGSGVSFVEILPTMEPELWEFSIESSGPSQMQISVARITDAVAPLNMAAQWSTTTGNAVQLEVCVNSPGWTVTQVSCECDASEAQTAHCFRGSELLRGQQQSGFESKYRLPIHLPRSPCSGTWSVKVLAVDVNGRQEAGWIDLPGPWPEMKVAVRREH